MAATVTTLAVSAGCADEPSESEIVLTVDDPPESLLQDLMRRDGVDEAAARAAYERTLLLSDAFREGQRFDDSAQYVDPQAQAFHERAALASLWLDRVFAPQHGTADMPREAFEDVLPRVEHPKLAIICQIIVMPRGVEGEERAKVAASADFQDQARPILAEAATAFEALRDQGLPVDDCRVFPQLAGVFTSANSSELVIKPERSVYPVCDSERFVQAWVDNLCDVDEPGLVGPFVSPFGLHLATVYEVIPPPVEPPEGFEQRAREQALSAWRAVELRAEIARLAARFDVAIVTPDDEPAKPAEPGTMGNAAAPGGPADL